MAGRPEKGAKGRLDVARAKVVLGPGSSGLGPKAISLPSLFPNAQGGNVTVGYPSEKSIKRTPSQLLLEKQQFSLVQSMLAKPKITGFQDLARFSNHTTSVVPVDQPLFSVHPPVVAFVEFEGLQTYETMVTLRNQDNVARRVKVCPPDSPFFELLPARRVAKGGTVASSDVSRDKIAPGMEVSYVVRFKPDARIDYSYDLKVVTEREEFSVPIRASGGSALLDFPDVIDFGDECIVGYQCERTVLVRNVGDRASKLLCRTTEPFSIDVPDGFLEEGASCQVSVFFTPSRAERYECDLQIKYGELEAVATLRGQARNAEVSLSHSLLLIEDTYVGLESQGVVTIRNDSDVPIDFSWRLFSSTVEEAQHRLALHRQLKTEEMDELLYMQQANLSEDEESESGSDGERRRVRRERKVTKLLGRKYDSIMKAVEEDPMLFRDAIFKIEPLCGRLWPQTQVTCACCFLPKDALVYCATAFLSAVGQEDRAPLVLKGLGIGPKATFSYDELDVGNVFVESAHRYEVQLLNQGDIEFDFRLVHREGKFAPRFKFTPDHGTIAVGGQCEIVVDFKPKELGPFHEVFEWALQGSATAVTLAFRGTSVRPKFEFDVDKINFGTVSFGFLNSRMLTLTNTSEVPCYYTLTVKGDEAPPNNEFEIIPSRGTLLPNCAQRIQVDFISQTEKKYDMRLSVDLEGVGKELLSIPMFAQCAVPTVSFEPHGCLNYGDVFIRYPFHQSLYLHNTSVLPAKFMVETQEDKSKAEFEPDQWVGTVPPCASHVITVTLTAHTAGPLRIPMYVKIVGREVPFPLVLVGNSVGPRVVVDLPSLDFGNVKCLEPVTKHVRLTNFSCIDASVRAFMNERKSLWTVHPKVIHLSPQETLQLALTVRMDETCQTVDTLNLIVSEGDDLTVQVRAKGGGSATDTPVTCDEELEFLDFGTIFTTQTCSREVIIKNHGQFGRRLAWAKEKEKDKKKNEKKEDLSMRKRNKNQDEGITVFRVEPEASILDPKTAYRFTFMASSQTPGTVEDELVCTEIVEKGGGGKTIFRTRMRANFVQPQLKLSRNRIDFEFLWDKNRPISSITESLRLENNGPLEVRFTVQVQYPFSTDIEEGGIPPDGSQEILVDFDPGYKVDRKSGTVKQRMAIQYDEHPAVNMVDLVGKVVWPNIELDTHKIDFGTVLNDTSKKMEVRMTNPTVLSVAYRWCFALVKDRAEKAEEASNPRTPATLTSGMDTRTSLPFPGRMQGSVAGFSSHDGDVFAPSSPVSTSASWASLATSPPDTLHDVELSQVFDILPIYGKLEPGETQVATFTYEALRDRSFRAVAVCMVDGGPEYEVQLKGTAAPCKYSLDRTKLDFGDIPFTEVGESELYLSNKGQVPASFNFNLSGVSRPFVVDVVPSTGTLKPEERLKVNVRFRAGIPDLVVETVLVEVAHLEATVLTVRGLGTFPGVVLDLPRKNEAEHRLQLDAAAKRLQMQPVSSSASEPSEIEVQMMTSSKPGSAAGFGRSKNASGSIEVAKPGSAPGFGRSKTASGVTEDQNGSPRSHAATEFPEVPDDRSASAEMPDFDLEFEVDRHYLCEVLLKSGGAQNTSPRPPISPQRRTHGIDTTPVTAAYYVCDFGHIALGQVSTRKITIHNCCSEPVAMFLDKKLLRDNDFLVEPDSLKTLPAGKSFQLQVSACRARDEAEGTMELEWNLPVRGGPNYKVQLLADFVLPDLVLSHESIDFGRIIRGHKKRVTMELQNNKAVPVEWAYVEHKDKYGRESVFDLVPSHGILEPGERKLLTVSFAPIGAQVFTGTLQIRMRDNQRRKSINVQGRGDVLRLEVRPSLSYQLGPVMPNSEGCSEEFWLVNPTDYPIEVYSTEFDEKYLVEERALADYDGYMKGMAEVSVRQPGDGMWPEVARRVVEVRKARQEEERKAKEEAAAGDVTQPLEEARDPAELEREAALQARAEQELADLEKIMAQPPPEEVDLTLYPYRVKTDRVNAVLVGPAKSGMSSLARSMSREDHRCVLKIDDVLEWVKQGPSFLHDDWMARLTQKRLQGGRPVSVEEVAHVLKRRVELPDCNTGIILDGVASAHLGPKEVLDVLLEGLKAEKLVLVTVDLPPTLEAEPEAPAEPLPEGAPNPPPAPSVHGEALGQLYDALSANLKTHVQALRAQLPALEAAKKAQEETLANALAAVKEAEEQSELQAQQTLDPKADPPAEDTTETEPVDLQAQLHAAKQALFDTQREMDLLQAEIDSCDANATWKPPEVEVDPEIQASIDSAREAQQAAAKARAKSKPKPGDAEEQPPAPPIADMAVEALAEAYTALQALAIDAFQRHNDWCRETEEERQREQERRRRQRKAAAQAAKDANRRTKGPAPEVIDLTASDFEPLMEDWEPPTDIQAMPFAPLPFEEYQDLFREILPFPVIPEEPPLPSPSLLQRILQPPDRPERRPLANFSILTPANAACVPLQRSPRSSSKEDTPAEGTEEEVKETYTSETRWIVEPQSELRLLVHFTSTEVATHYANLTFEVVDAVGSGPVYIGVSGVAALPGIATEPRQIFPRFKKRRPEDGYAVKAFVTSLGLYDFGPLLAGRTPSSRIPVVEEPEDDQGGEEGASPDETLLAPEAPAVQALSPYVLRHAENIRITNDSLFPANVRLGLASAGGDFAVGEDIKGPSPFIVEPDILKLEVQQEAEVKIWCFPPEKGVYKDRIVARIEHNPDPVAFDLNALGEIPGISLDREEVDFGRLMMNIRAEDQKVRIKNESAVAVRWQLLCKDSKSKAAEEAAEGETGEQAGPAVPEEIGVEPKEGQLAPHEEREIRFSFKSTHPAQFKTMLQLEARDAEGLNEWQKAANISVSAESFAVDAVIEPDPREVPLDFGTVLVHTSAQRIFEIVNRGRFPVRYELAIRRALRELLQIDQPKDELQPGERRAITVTCTPGRVFEASSDGIALQIFDQLSGESVDHRIPPMRVALTAVYNTFQVTPPRGLNFGPVEKGETQTRTFTIRNNGIFAFNWSLFDWADPPSIEEGQAPPAKPQVTVGPFTVKPTSGKLDPDDDVQVQVTFQATGDEDYDSKLAVWVDGVQGEASFEAGPAGCSSYLLTGQSCVPGINTTDLQTVFEEQFFTRTLEDAIAIAGRLDVRVFSEADQIFHFGPVLVKERGVGSSQPASPSGAPPDAGVTENLRLTNPKAVPCKVQLSIKQNSDTGAGSSDAFQVFPQELVISPHDSKQIQVKFTPTHLASFGAVLEAVVPQGTDPNSNYLSFELRGDGAVPSVSLQGPRLFGDEGGELDMGKLALFRSNEVQMGLRNDGLLPATVRVDFTPSQHFTVACPSSVSLNKGESRKFQVRFHPHAVGKVVSDLGIRTLGNPFEDVTIQLQGEGHSSEVCWDLAEVRRPGGVFGLRGALEPLQDYVPPSPDELDLGEVPVGELVKVNFKLNNSSSKPLHFDFTSIPSWGEAQVEPSTGYVEPNRQQTITFSFRPADKLQAEKEKILCKVVNVDFLEEEEGAEAGERKHQEVEGTSQQLPLQVSVLADVAKLEPEIEEINFLPTAMFCSKVYRFTLKNPSLLSVPFDWRIQGKLMSSYVVKPPSGIIPAESEKEIEVHFNPVEVENFDCTLLGSSPMIEGGKPVIRLPLTGSALRPWCHLEVPASEYRSRRQSDAPLDPKYHILEIISLGTHVKNTKRFYVMNPTAEPLDFIWQPEVPMFGADASDDECFKCLTKRGTILPNKKFEMSFEFCPQSSQTKESFWSFVLLGPKVEERFLVAGTVQEPRIGMDKPCINFGERLLQAVASDTVQLVNKEHIPFSFQIDPASFQEEGGLQALSISPMSGVIGPDSSVTVHVNFKPLEERPFNINVACNIKRKKEPVILNVKGVGYKIHASLAIEEPAGRRVINAGVLEPLDMGMLQVHERRELVLYLRNDSKRNFNYQMQMLVGANRKPKAIGSMEKPPYIALSSPQGVAIHHEETPIELKYAPRDAHMLDGSILQLAIPAGPVEETFSIALTGGAKRSRVEFSFLSHDFGPCFIARGGATMAGEPFAPSEDMRYERVDLIATNRDDSDCLISTTFQREPWLDVQLNAAMIEAGGSLHIPIVFSPREVCEYMQRIEFIVNDYTRMHLDVRGRGCPLKLELTESDMQNIDFGVTRGNEPVSRHLRLVNRSPRPVTFRLSEEGMAEHAVSWSPAHPCTLRPRQTVDFELRFNPTYRIAPFRLPLVAQCEHGVEVRLLYMTGTCHAIEMRLSEHSVFFGDVVVGSQATKAVRLHNFGDLGAKFRFEVGAKYSKIFSVTPSEGFVRPQEDINLTVAFHPTHERILEFKRSDKQSRKSLKMDLKDVNIGITARDIRCVLEGHAPLMLEASGKCVSQPGETKLLEFFAQVRTKTQNSFVIQNPTESDWKLYPQVATQEPPGSNYFSCEKEIVVPAKKDATVQIFYMPLTMTAGGDSTGSPSSGKPRVEKHKGTIFLGTPDGNAVCYELEGEASPPEVGSRIDAKVPCKKKHTQAVPVKNWLHERQRFSVTVELVSPEPGTSQAQGISLQGVGTLDLPPGLEREYRFSVYAYHEGTALVRVNLTSQETGEFMNIEVKFDFFAAESLATIKLEAACRQVARHKIAVANPLMQPARFTGSASLPFFRFSPETLEVPPRSEKTMEIIYRPLEEGEGDAEVMLKSPELGTYPYTLNWRATPAGFERALVLKAPLGGSVVENFKFLHYAKETVKYKAKVEAAPGQKGPGSDFFLESSEVTATGATGEPVPTELGVKFQPSMLGECRALLVISGPGGGEYKALLTGFAQPPQPQGPITMMNGKQGTVEFRNPFDKPTDFSLQVDNPCFMVPTRTQRIDPQKSVQISVNFKSDRPQGGRLIISCDKVSTPWIFFLKGEV